MTEALESQTASMLPSSIGLTFTVDETAVSIIARYWSPVFGHMGPPR